MTIMYIHGYGSDGNALKGKMLRAMLPAHRVVSPTFDYDRMTPQAVQALVRKTVEEEGVKMLVGSSFGGYHALCATQFFHGPVWAVNPVSDVEETIRRVVTDADGSRLAVYHAFDREVFRRQVALNQSGRWPEETPLHFALSTDDELLGDHTGLLTLFPRHRQVVWKEDCGHRFLRFKELESDFLATIKIIER